MMPRRLPACCCQWTAASSSPETTDFQLSPQQREFQQAARRFAQGYVLYCRLADKPGAVGVVVVCRRTAMMRRKATA